MKKNINNKLYTIIKSIINKLLIFIILSFLVNSIFIDNQLTFWNNNVDNHIEAVVKTVENKEKIIIIYTNKTKLFINKFLNNLKGLFWQFNTLITLYKDNNDYKNDTEFLKLKSFYKDEINFIKWLKEKWIELKEDEKLSFFNFIWAWKTKSFFSKNNEEEYTRLLFLDKKWKGDNIFYKILLNINKQNITIQEKKEERFETVYWWKLYIPKNSMIYDTKIIYSKDVNIPYIIIWFYTKSWIGVSIMSITSNYWNIDLVSDVTWVFINNDTWYYAYKQRDCDQKLKYFYVKENTLYWYCLNKNNKNILENILIK